MTQDRTNFEKFLDSSYKTIDYSYSAVNDFIKISTLFNTHKIAASLALSKIKQIDTKVNPIVKNAWIAYETVQIVIDTTKKIAENQTIFISALENSQKAMTHFLDATSYLSSYIIGTQPSYPEFDTVIPNSTTTYIDDHLNSLPELVGIAIEMD